MPKLNTPPELGSCVACWLRLKSLPINMELSSPGNGLQCVGHVAAPQVPVRSATRGLSYSAGH